MKTFVLVLAASLAGGGALAQTTTPEALALLRKMYEASQRLSYTGVFVYEQGDRTETSRMTRIAGTDGGVERLEVLGDSPREVIRSGGTVRCYYPDRQLVKVERQAVRAQFPALVPERFTELARHYHIVRGGNARIAGIECESVILVPHDGLRYGHKLWADARTGLLLRARTVNDKGETVEQYTFTQIQIGKVPRAAVRPRPVGAGWRVEEANATPASLAEVGWSVAPELPGFRKVAELRRALGEAHSVGQVVYTDGLASLSVFIEPLSARPATPHGLSRVGAIHIVTREVADHLITVVGETPAASVQRLAESVRYRRP